MVKDKFHLSWLKRTAIKAYLHSPRKVQVGLAKFGIKHVVRKKTLAIKRSLKSHA